MEGLNISKENQEKQIPGENSSQERYHFARAIEKYKVEQKEESLKDRFNNFKPGDKITIRITTTGERNSTFYGESPDPTDGPFETKEYQQLFFNGVYLDMHGLMAVHGFVPESNKSPSSGETEPDKGEEFSANEFHGHGTLDGRDIEVLPGFISDKDFDKVYDEEIDKAFLSSLSEEDRARCLFERETYESNQNKDNTHKKYLV